MNCKELESNDRVQQFVSNIKIGVYFLIHKDEIVYVGQSTNIDLRITNHKEKVFDRILYILVKKERLILEEDYYISLYKPRYNKTLEINRINRDETKTNMYITFDILDNMVEGQKFSGLELQDKVLARTNKKPYVSSILRFVRMWRVGNREVKCINRAKSLYQIGDRL